MPECDVNLVHAVTYLSLAPKSNALYRACEECKADVKQRRAEPVPLWLRNAPTGLMKQLHYGEGYEYAHNTEEKLTHMQCMPEGMEKVRYYRPDGQGKEKEAKQRLEEIMEFRNK